MKPWKIRLSLSIERRKDQGIMTGIGRTNIVGMIDMMMTGTMTIVGIIVIIHQEMIGDHTRVTYTMMIDEEMMTGEMMIIVDIIIEGMKIQDLKELDKSKTRIGTI